MPGTNLERQIAAIALLDEPIRRGLYLFVAERRHEVGRDEAAGALHISRALAAFHLDKLVQQGLLEETGQLTVGSAGRPAKLYHRSARQLDLTLPERRYELAGRVLARALTAMRPAARGALERAARAEGRRLGADARHRTAVKAGTDRLFTNTLAVLAECGYEPARVNGEVRLRNCPFDALANECRPLVCGMNLALLRGLLAAAGTRGTRAQLRPPEAGSCCVVLKISKR